MNFLLVNYEYPPVGAGAATATKAIAHALRDADHKVLVLTAAFGSLPATADEEGVTVRRVRCRRTRADRCTIAEMLSFLAAGAAALPRVLKEHRSEAAIIFFSFPCGPLGLLGRWLKRVPYVISLRGGDVPGTEAGLARVHRLLMPLRRLLLRQSVAVIANSEGLRRLAVAADPVPVGIIPNGVDTEFFRPTAEPRALDEEPFRIVFTGRFQAQKNVSILLEQCAALAKSRAPFELHLVGDGPLRADLEQQAERLGLAAATTWHGWSDRERLRGIYQRSHCFVNPSSYEGMPNAVLEAMACGLPVIASDVPGNDAVVRHGESGLLFDLNRPADLHDALANLLRDRDAARQMGEKGRADAKQNFSWAKTAAEYAELFRVR